MLDEVKSHVKVRVHPNIRLPSVQVLAACVDPVEGMVPFRLLVLCPFCVVEVSLSLGLEIVAFC